MELNFIYTHMLYDSVIYINVLSYICQVNKLMINYTAICKN